MAFKPRLDILPPAQTRLWAELSAIPAEFTLYGGTAIALQLGHRHSEDFDFFGDQALDAARLQARIAFLDHAEVLQLAAGTATYLIDRGGAVKVSFFSVPGLGRVDPPLIAQGNKLKIASLRDLAGMKVAVAQVRSEAKDYLDIAALIEHGIDLPTALAAALAIYGRGFNPQNALKALVYFGDGDLPSLPAKTKRMLRRAVSATDLGQLAAIVPERRYRAPRRPRR